MVAGTCPARGLTICPLLSCARPHLDPRRQWGLRAWA